jgi:acetate kinase
MTGAADPAAARPPVNVLVFNCGSSSQGFRVYAAGQGREPRLLVAGKARHVATASAARPRIEWRVGDVEERRELDLPTHALAATAILDLLAEQGVAIDAVGHRFVHGGARFSRTAAIDEVTLPALRAAAPLAPIHNPNTLAVIDVCGARFPATPQYAVFDTTFFAGLPPAATTYALPTDLAARFGFRKGGFHGLSYQYVSRRTAELLGRPLDELRLVVAHLGTGGSSVAAIAGGRPVDTSIGTTMSGLVMSTRSGDIPPEVELTLMRAGYGPDEIEDILANRSGVLGLAGVTSDILEATARAEEGDAACRLAVDVYVHRLSTYLGAYTWLLGGADAIAFTDDAGTRGWQLREAACHGGQAFGARIDPVANRAAIGVEAAVHEPGSPTAILVVPTDEERVILEEVLLQVAAAR